MCIRDSNIASLRGICVVLTVSSFGTFADHFVPKHPSLRRWFVHFSLEFVPKRRNAFTAVDVWAKWAP
eukprot:7371194-Pyramimonas_sp.AAC.1